MHKSFNTANQNNPQLSDFGAAVVHPQIQQAAMPHAKPVNVVGTFGYLAPEYVMYGKVDEKIDVYSYGVVLLELITGKEAIERNPTSNQDSLVLWVMNNRIFYFFSNLKLIISKGMGYFYKEDLTDFC